jgi:hypothetical protein
MPVLCWRGCVSPGSAVQQQVLLLAAAGASWWACVPGLGCCPHLLLPSRPVLTAVTRLRLQLGIVRGVW